MNQLIKFLNLNRDKKILLIQTCILLNLVRLGLFILPFSTLKDFLAKLDRIQHRSSSSIMAKNIAVAVNRSSRLSLGTVKCLAKALTTNALMNFYNLPCKLVIGVAKSPEKGLEAHAWVEAEGKIVMGYLPDLARFQTMTSTSKGLFS